MIKKGFSMLVAGLLYLVSLLPFFVLYWIADLLFILVYYVIGYRRKVVQSNLLAAFPEKSEEERRSIEKDFFKYLGELIVETIKLLTISEKEIEQRLVVNDVGAVANLTFAQGRSIIAPVGHYGNWEMCILRLGLLANNGKGLVAYKPLSDPYTDTFFLKIRQRFGTIMVPMKQTMRKLIQLRNEPTFTVLAGDQTPPMSEANYFTQFLNQPTAVYLGPEKLAKTFNSVVIFCDIRRIKRGYYSCTFVPLFDQPKLTAEYEITNAHVRYLEKVIREEPRYWLWSHRRWKFKPEDIH